MSEDSIPLLSQLKCLILLVRGDKFGARETQRAFICQCVVISQLYSLFKYLWEKDTESAMDIQFEFYRSTFIAVPIISQLLSICLCLRCDFQSAWRIQQIFINQITDLLFVPFRLLMYLCHPWPRIVRPLHGLHPIKNKMKKIRKKSQKLLEFLNMAKEEDEEIKKKKKEEERKKESEGQIPLKCWMKEFVDYPLSYLTLPGTHNAHAYKFQWAFSFISNFAVNQHWDIYRQLKNGARCLDIRVGQNSNGDIVCAHRFFVSVKFEKVMKHVAKYLNKYPTEIVMLRVKCESGWKNDPPKVNQLVEIAKKHVGHRLAPLIHDQNYSKGILDMKIKDLLTKQWNVILFYEFQCNEYQLVTSWNQTRSELPKPLLHNIVNWIQDIPDNKKALREQFMEKLDVADTIIDVENNDHIEPFSTSAIKEEEFKTNETMTPLICKKEDEMAITPKPTHADADIKSNLSTQVKTKEKYQALPTIENDVCVTTTESKKWYLVSGQITAKFTLGYILHQLMHGVFGLRCDVEFVNGQVMKELTGQLIHKVNVIECDFLHPLLVRKIVNVNKYYCGFIDSNEIDETEDEQLLL